MQPAAGRRNARAEGVGRAAADRRRGARRRIGSGRRSGRRRSARRREIVPVEVRVRAIRREAAR